MVKLSTEELKVVDKVIEEVKGLVKTYGYEYTVTAMTRYIKNTKEKRKVAAEIKEKEKELERLKNTL